jgi:hypothetical protein
MQREILDHDPHVAGHDQSSERQHSDRCRLTPYTADRAGGHERVYLGILETIEVIRGESS